ncbi:alpha-L-glutamate ligase [Nakamurella sp. A5-74]|uniref:Alpha-L-glutamate ligase n=1 Tax=Nakamurella sp. A5-74 TaxID=3158264 RepID=A0AAU8DUG3_9ACTN
MTTFPPDELPVSDRPAVYVLHENPEWIPPFAAAFAAAGVPLIEWRLAGGVIDLAQAPPEGVFWSRFSASSHTRGNALAKDHTRSVLSWLEAAGRRTVNGRAVIELEVSKIAQLAALQAHGIDTPRTVAVIGSDRLAAAAERFISAADDPAAPFLIKHNQGGKGLGVNRFDDLDGLRDHLASADFEEPVDGITLIQEYVPPADGTITRCEFVGGEFVYAIRADTVAGGFQLCPADACAIGPDGRPVIPPGAQRAPEPGEQIFLARSDIDDLPLAAYRSFLRAASIEIAGIELIQAADGRIVTYDVNTNTNYNAAVESTIQASGPAAIARYLGGLLADSR